MKKTISTAAVLLVACSVGFSQSSGNFSASGTGASCAIGAGGSFTSPGTPLTSFSANISSSSGNGVTLDIRPDLVTGLFTQTKIDTSVSSASADIGIEVCVEVDGKDNAHGAGILPTDCAVYDQRFQQISSQLFSQLSECNLNVTTTACTVDSDCASGSVCFNPTGGTLTGFCATPNPLCNFQLILSTLSAHSFDFVVPVSQNKQHVITASWKTIGLAANNTGGSNSSVASCVGPGILTVTQTKLFKGALSF
jgi:hypothetical protein